MVGEEGQSSWPESKVHLQNAPSWWVTIIATPHSKWSTNWQKQQYRKSFFCFIDCGWLRGVLWRTHCCCEFHYIGCVWISLNLIARRLRLIINKNKHREQCKGKCQHDLPEHGSHSVCAGRTEMFESIREAQSREKSQCGENCTTKKQQFPHRDNSATVWICVPCLFVDF